MIVDIERIIEKEILVADLGLIKLYKIVEENDDLLENSSK